MIDEPGLRVRFFSIQAWRVMVRMTAEKKKKDDSDAWSARIDRGLQVLAGSRGWPG